MSARTRILPNGTRITPFPLDECCICDGPSVALWRHNASDELVPYCAADLPEGGQRFGIVYPEDITPTDTGYLVICPRCGWANEYAKRRSARSGVSAHRCERASS